MRTSSTADWEKRLNEANVPHAVVWNYAEVFAQPQAQSRGMKVTVRDPQGRPVDLIGNPIHLKGGPLREPTSPPNLGEQTASVLHELLGMNAEAVEELRQRGIV